MEPPHPIVILRPEHRRIIADASLAALPAEACGLLLGHLKGPRRVVEEVVLTPNMAGQDRLDRFEVDPRVLLATHRRARERDLHILGHFHSHPNGKAEPSSTDAANVLDIGQLWLIQPIINDEPALPAAFLAVRDIHIGWPFVALALHEDGA